MLVGVAEPEHVGVDDHQLRFARWMADKGQIVVIPDLGVLEDQLALALNDGMALRLDGDDDETAAAVARFTELVNDLMESRGR